MFARHQAQRGQLADLASLAQHHHRLIHVVQGRLAGGADARTMLHHRVRHGHQPQRLAPVAQLPSGLLAAAPPQTLRLASQAVARRRFAELLSPLVSRFTWRVVSYTAVLLAAGIARPFLAGVSELVMGAQVATPQRSSFELTPADERLQRQLLADEAAQWLDRQDGPLMVEEADLPCGRIQLP